MTTMPLSRDNFKKQVVELAGRLRIESNRIKAERSNPQDQHERRMLRQRIRRQEKKVMQSSK